jgi:hypothetical protein
MFRTFCTLVAAVCISGAALSQPPTPPKPVSNVHVFIPKKDRILNKGGNCGYCSFEMACRYHGIRRGYGIAAKNPATGLGGHKGAIALIRKLKLKHGYIYDKKNTNFLLYWVAHKRYPVVVHGEDHIVLLVHYAPPLIKILDNTGSGAGVVRVWPEEKFVKWWSGRAYVVLPD